MSIKGVSHAEEKPPTIDGFVEKDTLDEKQIFENCGLSEMPQLLDYVPDNSISTDQLLHGGVELEEETEGNNLSFLVSEDSIVLNETHYEQFPSYPEHAAVSSCFSRSRQLACEDSVDAGSREAANPSKLFQTCRNDDDYFLTTAEETSMDSGLGSVDSAYANSEEESASSPENTETSSSAQINTSPTTTATEATSTSTAQDIFYDCLSEAGSKLMKKRFHDDEIKKNEEPAVKKPKIERKVSFQDVTIFYFPRKQGFVTVPSQGGSTLGMSMEHNHCSVMSLQDYKLETKQRHKEKILEHLRERRVEDKIKQLKFLNPLLDNGTLTSMAQEVLGRSEEHNSPPADDSLLDNFDDYFFLQPIPAKKRRKILRSAGVERIDGEEKLMNRILRESREMCGCTCEEVCIPDSCECALSGIQCQVDRESFPCGCNVSGCRNENGRIEFDSDRVRVHLLKTLEKLNRCEDGLPIQEDSDRTELEKYMMTSSGSECDFVSSDDADQSDGDALDAAECARLQNAPNKVCSDSQHCPANRENSDPDNSQIPPEFLATLRLKKIDADLLSLEIPIERPWNVEPVVTISSNELFNANNAPPQPVSYEDFSCGRKTMDSIAQPVPDPIQSTHQMYGTTSPTSYCQGASANRDLSIALDPISTFMRANCNAATTESASCNVSL